jgi:hypothetical protein
MREITYEVRGFLTVRRDSWRVPLSGSLTVRADPGPGPFTGDLVLRPSSISRGVLGAQIVRATVQIVPVSPVTGRIGLDGQLSATVTVEASIATARVAGWPLTSGDACRTATHASVPLRSRAGFRLEEGGRLAGRYDRPPFTGCGWLTPVVNLLAAGPGNAVVIDLIPRPSHPGSVTPGSRRDAP